MTQEELIEDLKQMTHQLINSAKSYKSMKPARLNSRLSEDSWSILECFEHMNRYDTFYLDELSNKLERSPSIGTDERWFKSGWIGGRTANSMIPQDGKMRKMKTFKNMDPQGSTLSPAVIDNFIKDQRGFLDVLRMAKEKDLNKVKVKLTLPLLKFKAGDAFRFIQNHNARHMAQCKRISSGLN